MPEQETVEYIPDGVIPDAEPAVAAAPAVPDEKEYDPRELDKTIRAWELVDYPHRRCLIITPENAAGRQYWVNNLGSYTSRENANIFETDFCIKNGWCGKGHTHFNYELLRDTPLPEGKKCFIRQVLPSSIIELVKKAPAAKLTRGLLLKFLRVMPPDECDTYDKLRDWIEVNVSNEHGTKQKPEEPQARRSPTPQNHNDTRLDVEWNVDEQEHGRANYSVTRYGSGTARVSLQVVLDAIDNGEDMDGILEQLREEIINESSYEFNGDSGDYNYDNHEASDSSDFDLSLEGRTSLKQRILEALRQHHPEYLEKLDEN